MKALRLALVTLAACGIGSSSRQHVQVAHLSFEVPNDWHASDTNQRGLVTSVWTPDENSNKESVTVIRSERSEAVASAGPSTIARLLTGAQAPGARVSATTSITTQQGLSGVRIEADYVPPGLKATYHRVHVVLLDGTSLVHVFYTAMKPDPNLDTFNTIIASLHEDS